VVSDVRHRETFAHLGIELTLRVLPWAALPPQSGSEQRRVLAAECERPWRALSWAMHGGGVRTERRYVCAEVRNADLPLGIEPQTVVGRFLHELGYDSAIVTLTSADVGAYATGSAREGEVVAAVVVTAGLANALRVGEVNAGPPRRYLPDTINMACWVNVPLTFEAQLEAMSIVTQARTLEVLEAQVPSLEQNGWASGTGTDCIALFTLDESEAQHRYAGMHTAVGRVLGRAAREAVGSVVRAWKIAKERANAQVSR
jgi:adenosylcobinamide amidohydrolase